MARGRKPSENPVARGTLGHSMMSTVAELGPTGSAAEQGAEPGSDLQTELQKLDRAALSRSARASAQGAAGGRLTVTPQPMSIITFGAAAIMVAAMYKAVRARRQRLAVVRSG